MGIIFSDEIIRKCGNKECSNPAVYRCQATKKQINSIPLFPTHTRIWGCGKKIGYGGCDKCISEEFRKYFTKIKGGWKDSTCMMENEQFENIKWKG